MLSIAPSLKQSNKINFKAVNNYYFLLLLYMAEIIFKRVIYASGNAYNGSPHTHFEQNALV